MADGFLDRMIWDSINAAQQHGGVIDVQQPIPRPDPIPRPEPWSSPAPQRSAPVPRQLPLPVARPAPPRPAARPAAPQAAPAAAPPPVDDGDPSAVWHRLMARHQISPSRIPEVVDWYYRLDRGEDAGSLGLGPEVEADVRAYAKQFPRQGRPQLAQPAPEVLDPPQAARPTDQDGGSLVDRMARDAMRRAQEAQPAAPTPAPVAPPTQPPQTGGGNIFHRVGDAIRGKQDPAYANIPELRSPRLMGSMLLGAEDDDLARRYQEMFGDRYIATIRDANGYPIIKFRGEDGKEQLAYVNRPGLDMQDVVRGAMQAVPFILSGGRVAKMTANSGGAVRAGAQGGAAAATSLAQDVAGGLTGEVAEGLNPTRALPKAGAAALGGAAGEAIGIAGGAIWRKLVTEPRYFNSATGQLTERGAEAARAAGLDPAALPREMAQDMARQMARIPSDPAAAVRAAAGNEFAIPRTVGEISRDTSQLLREQQALGSAYGQGPADAMRGFRKRQDQAIQRAVGGEDGIAGQIAPGRAGQPPMAKDELGANIRGAANAARTTAGDIEDQAWRAVPQIRATPDALAELPNVVGQRVSGVLIDETVTPAAAKMAQAMDRMIVGEAPAKAASVLPSTTVGDVGQMRKTLLGYFKAAGTPEDKRAAGALYDAYNEWVAVAAQKAGDPTAAAAMLTARGISREIHDVFEGQGGTAGARILRDILDPRKGVDSAEGVVNALFSGPAKAETKAGSVTALQHLKTAYDRYLDPAAARAAWDDIRLAYWQRMTNVKTGEPGGPAALAASIKTALNNQGSVSKILFTPEERGRMLRLAGLLDDVARRNPNTSWSGVSIGTFMRDVGNAVVSMLGANSVIGRMAINMAVAPMRGAYGAAQVRAATGGGAGAVLPPVSPSLGGYGAGAGGYWSGGSDDRSDNRLGR